MFRSLAFKWTVTLLLTSLIGVILVGLFAYRTTVTEYDRLRSEQAREWFIEDVTLYYRVRGTWQGLEDWLEAEPESDERSRGYRPPQQFALADLNGVIVAGHGPFPNSYQLPAGILADGTPVIINGEQVGTALLAEPPPDLDPREQRYVDGTNRALVVGALGASATALVIGLLLSRQFLHPLSELTRAITAMHAGDLDQQVQIRTRDELGLLAQTFNEMSASLARANQLRKQMTADIAHDLRTPLTVIAGYLEALSDGTLKPTAERFRLMHEEVTLLQRLVEDLRTLSLADAGELRLMRGEIAPGDLIERVAAAFRDTATAAGLLLGVDVSAGLPILWLDSERMVQVLGNLVTNAIRHTPSGGRITLRARPLPDAVELQVSDTGSGIAPEDLPRIFDRFYRGDPSRQSDGGESGLGLAIVKSIVEAHGGTITVTSEAGTDTGAGTGTTMLIRLPLPAR